MLILNHFRVCILYNYIYIIYLISIQCIYSEVSEGTLASSSVASTALAGLALLPFPLPC